MSQDFHIAKFKHIEINDVEIGTLLYSITRNDTSEDFIILEKLYCDVVDNYKKYMRYLVITKILILKFIH